MSALNNPAEFARRLLRVTLPRMNTRWLGLLVRGRRIPEVTVSLTSYGSRLESVHAAIYSILRGTYLPQRIVLVVNEDLSDSVLQSLAPFKPWGLEILRSENLGPHTKYFPVIRAGMPGNSVLVTADDDIFYRRNWLERLWKSHQAHPKDVVCWWAKSMRFDGPQIRSYHDWPEVSNCEARPNYFALGVGGVLYPGSMISAIFSAGDRFLTITPKNDDIWLHSLAVESGHLIRQVTAKFEWPRHIPGTQEVGLKHANHLEDGNDKAVRLTYSAHAVDVIRQAAV